MVRPLVPTACLLALLGSALAQERPGITGVSHIALYAEDIAKSADYYTGTLGLSRADAAESEDGARFIVGPGQYVELMALPAGTDPRLRLDHIAFATDDADRLRAYLDSRGVDVPPETDRDREGRRRLAVTDPEGNRVEFIQAPAAMEGAGGPGVGRMIHVGFIVHDPDAMDAFYKDILGFTAYWAGGNTPGHDEWVSIQVPDGTDWLEYMVVGEPDGVGVPEGMDRRLLGILNHFALGMADAREIYTALWREDRLDGQDEVPKIGLDAKWQLNLYDPDGTRAEFMEYAPVGEPCCNPFSGEHPAPPR